MGNKINPTSPQTDPVCEPTVPVFEIRVKGCMDEEFWSDWFGDLEFAETTDQGETILRGQVADQAELYGLLSRLRNKGLSLVAVQQISG